MDFAEKELKKYGWIKGEGLGRGGTGRSEAVKVKLKRDRNGVGVDPGSEFTSDWWNKVYNSTASNIEVKQGKMGEVVLATTTDSSRQLKKKHYANHRKDLIHGQFLPSTSLYSPLDGCAGGDSERKSSVGKGLALTLANTEPGGRGEEDNPVVLTDEVLFEACGGRTAHKGARHGLTLSGKLSRVERQEEETLATCTSLERTSDGGKCHKKKRNRTDDLCVRTKRKKLKA